VIRIQGPATTRLRYGRATLTVAVEGGLLLKDLEAVTDYERGELTAEELCDRFVRGRVRQHSPTFDWAEADPQRVRDLVLGASRVPRFASADPEVVADELVVMAREDLEALKETTRKLIDAVAPKVKIEKIFGTNNLDAVLGRTGLAGTIDVGKLDVGNITGPKQRKMLDSFLGNDFYKDAVRKLGLFGQQANPVLGNLRSFGMAGIDPKLFEAPAWMRRLPDTAPWLKGIEKQFGSLLESMKEALPPNWRELEPEEHRGIVQLMQAEGLNLAWAPRAEILRKLLTATSHAERCEILGAHRDEIIDDVEQVLGRIERDDLRPVAEAGFVAIRAYGAGYAGPAQTYAAAAIGHVLHGPLGYSSFSMAIKTFRSKDPMHDVGYQDFPLFAVGHALARALDRIKDAGDGFNRNVTLHGIGDGHNEPNLLMVLLLLAGLLAEVERELDRHDAWQTDRIAV